MPVDPEKYVVFNRADFIRITGYTGDFPPPLPDAVVIRLQDIFAAPALFTYANSIQTVIELLDQWGTDISLPTYDHLTEIRDYFFERATTAQASYKKLPD